MKPNSINSQRLEWGQENGVLIPGKRKINNHHHSLHQLGVIHHFSFTGIVLEQRMAKPDTFVQMAVEVGG